MLVWGKVGSWEEHKELGMSTGTQDELSGAKVAPQGEGDELLHSPTLKRASFFGCLSHPRLC